MTLLRKEVFPGVFRLKILTWGGKPGPSWWILNPMTSVLPRERWTWIWDRQKRKHREKEAMWPQRQRLERHNHKSKNANSHWSWKRQRTDLCIELLEGEQPCQHHDYRFLASNTVWEYISAVLSYQFCGNVLQQPQETNTRAINKSSKHLPANPCTGNNPRLNRYLGLH